LTFPGKTRGGTIKSLWLNNIFYRLLAAYSFFPIKILTIIWW